MRSIQLTVAAIVVGIVLSVSSAAGAQVRQPVQGEGVTLTEVSRLADVEQGSTCRVEALNNTSVYPENVLVIESGTGGGDDHPHSTSYTPVEQFDGEDLIVNIVASGGDVVVSVAWVVHTSVDDIPITCTPPSEETCPIADAIDAGWTPGGDIPCGHGPDVTTTTTTNVPPETTTSTSEAPPTSPPPPEETCPDDGLACTGTSTAPILAGMGAVVLLIGVLARFWDTE